MFLCLNSHIYLRMSVVHILYIFLGIISYVGLNYLNSTLILPPPLLNYLCQINLHCNPIPNLHLPPMPVLALTLSTYITYFYNTSKARRQCPFSLSRIDC
jgi:hypothetical protein